MPAATITIRPSRRVHGRLHVPGDKSIAHRYALLAALASGPSRIAGFAPGADCHSTLHCLRQLGVEIVQESGGTISITGRGLGRLKASAESLDAGNSGTTMRMLAGVLAAQPFASRLIGDTSLSRRPMRRVIGPLESMGARIESTDGHAPLVIHGSRLQAIDHRPDVPSAQVKSAVLLAGLHAAGTTTVTEPAQTRDHTERALEAFGARLGQDGPTLSLVGGQPLTARSLSVPGDFSSAAFWLVAAAALPGSRVELHDIGLNPTRTALLGVLQRFGARVHVEVTGTDAGEPRGVVVVEADRTSAIEIAPAEVPGLIDELPALAALAAYGGEVGVRGATELRVKESDRIAALVAGFRGLGIAADERDDGFVIHGSGVPAGGVVDAHGDHRIAMALAIAALGARGPSSIDGARAVSISYPDFFETLDRLVA